MAMVDFGVLRRIRPSLGSTVGAAELLLALFLATGTYPILFLSIAAGLLWIFVLLIAKSLWSGKRFACFCFGDADSKLSSLTLIRTATLAILTSVLVVAPPPTMYGGLSGTYVLQAVSAMALLGTIVLSAQLFKLLGLGADPHRIANAEVNK
jgi:hypothetical protein